MTQEGYPSPHGVGRYLFWGVASALLAAFIAWSFVPAAVPVDLGTVERGAMAVRVEGEGRTRVRDVYAVSAPAAGVLLRVEAQPGDPVKAGQTLLAIIEPADPTILDQRSRAEGAATVQAAEDALNGYTETLTLNLGGQTLTNGGLCPPVMEADGPAPFTAPGGQDTSRLLMAEARLVPIPVDIT